MSGLNREEPLPGHRVHHHYLVLPGMGVAPCAVVSLAGVLAHALVGLREAQVAHVLDVMVELGNGLGHRWGWQGLTGRGCCLGGWARS